MERYIEELQDLLNLKSPTGHTELGIKVLEDRFKAMGLFTYRTNKGALIAKLPGIEENREVTLAAHIDTLGAMVKEITNTGKVRMTQIGGYAWSTIEGEYVEIETMDGQFITGTILVDPESSHVHGSETSTVQRTGKNLYVRLDERVSSKEDVLKLGINVGDFIHLDPRVEVSKSGYIKSRHLDNKAGVIALIAIAEHFIDHDIKPNFTTNFFISNYEEVGHGAAAAIPEKTSEFIAFDMAALGDGQSSDEFSVTICAKDSSGPYDYDLKKRLVQLAMNENLNYKLDIYPFYGSDGSAALKAGNDIRVALIGPGVHASHSFERTHIEAIDNTIKLGIAYLTE
ncbi:M42 family metallopeptidase [Erysipelothrix urinaevulpis]|uniref:M42 family metallopeptidase n=1 Tax=Erysipelothrix urinaevulpis TaxID=2683717 RepID=UPI001356DA40|nr:M42 family metallopeptidase [Erysipelothrix urinaevulpis]